MNVNDFMAKHGITDADLDRMASPYEDASFEAEPNGKVHSGSHLDAAERSRAASHDPLSHHQQQSTHSRS